MRYKNQKLICVLSLILVIGMVFAGRMDAIAAGRAPKLSATKLTLFVGDSKKLTVTNGKNVKWTSSQKSVATVSKNGTVKAKKAGTATITASVSGKKLKCVVTVKKASPVVVLYFSATGTTKGVAERIERATDGRLIEITAAEPYTDEDIDYGDPDSRVCREHGSAASHAESTLRPEVSNMSAIRSAVENAEVVFIGYPIWWGEAPHIVYNVAESVDLKGKTVIPFCTSASSGLGDSGTMLKSKANISSKTNWLAGRGFYDVPSQGTVDEWVRELGL